LDRGLFRSTFFRTYINEAQTNETIEKPKKEEVSNLAYDANYNKIDEDGYIAIGAKVNGATTLIGKTTSVIGGTDKTKKDVSVFSRDKETGIVDQIVATTNEQGQRISKVKVRSSRMPEVGDKLASRHAQKGTIGLTLRQEDMPFTCEGITPDIIINTHAIPSRMTVGQLIECVLGKIGSMDGTINDSTVFGDFDYNNIAQRLQEVGYQNKGNEVMYSGLTGEKMDAQIFLGPTYYQRLKHLVKDKIYCRAKGPIQPLVRQPVEGRGRDGGLRLIFLSLSGNLRQYNFQICLIFC
jgi:DNA-directed RNA polymerase II subunit RPB2